MANTYTQLYIQFVFAVQDRASLIQKDWKDELYKYITGIVQSNKHKLIAINGMPNHLHVFVGYKPHQLIPDLLQDIKGSSSLWINKRNFVHGKFSWQEGYGAFSYSHSHIDKVYKYIINQEQHHKKRTFTEEYTALLDSFEIEYNDKYILKDIAY
jgi:REP element-mobilizing transposase RayT